jgi:hypothetical protein
MVGGGGGRRRGGEVIVENAAIDWGGKPAARRGGRLY